MDRGAQAVSMSGGLPPEETSVTMAVLAGRQALADAG